MGPSINLPTPQTPKPPPGPPMYGANAAAGMRQKKQALSNESTFGSFLGTQAPQSPTGGKTLLGQ